MDLDQMTKDHFERYEEARWRMTKEMNGIESLVKQVRDEHPPFSFEHIRYNTMWLAIQNAFFSHHRMNDAVQLAAGLIRRSR